MTKKAFITGISGQDGSYLAEFLLSKGYEVHGLVLRVEMEDPERSLWRISHLTDQVTLHPGSIESFPSLFRIFEQVQPDECYHLAAASFVSYSFDDEFAIFNANVNGTHYMLSVIMECQPQCRFYFAASSEMFGNAESSPQNEHLPLPPPLGLRHHQGDRFPPDEKLPRKPQPLRLQRDPLQPRERAARL